MLKLTTVIAAALLVSPLAASADSFTGTLVDTKCYGMSASNVGNDHKGGELKGCASACAKMGIPVALLIDGKVHVIAAPAPMLADAMGKEATITGMMSGDVIMPEKVMVDGKEVQIGAMM